MLSIGAVQGAGATAAYFGQDDYYAHGDEGPSLWYGGGAEALGLNGEVGKDEFKAVLEGIVDEGDRIGHEKDGEWVHQSGWDLTFSAPKSVSVMAEVAGDERLIKAHDEAVRAVVAKIEKETAGTRVMEQGQTRIERTGSLVAAIFRHDLNRNHDPQLHSHVVIANMTETKNGWRSLHSKEFYDQARSMGVLYQQELAIRVKALGYNVQPEGKGFFQISGVDETIRKAFSTRRAEIEKKLEAMGPEAKHDPAAAAAAALSTRRRKTGIDRSDAASLWTERLTKEEVKGLSDLRNAAQERGAEASGALTEESRNSAADRFIRFAVAALSERDAAFSKERVVEFAGKAAIGAATEADLKASLDRYVDRGHAIGKQVTEADRKAQADLKKEGLTTRRVQRMEQAVLDAERAGRGAVPRLVSPKMARATLARAEERSAAAGYSWTGDQRDATAALLISNNRIHAVQGLAGTAKTSTVLATFAHEARRRGREIVALAPTGSAAETLGAALGGKGMTVDQHLINLRTTRIADDRAARKIWIVDEASMLSTEKMHKLVTAAEKRDARLIVVGDVRQLGSVEAGAVFRQLQQAGMATERLETIVRQTSDPMRQSVERAAAGDALGALRHLEEGAGSVAEFRDRPERHAHIARTWMALTPEERERTIIIEPGKDGRRELNDVIRSELVKEGSLGGHAVNAPSLEAKGLTTAEKKMPFSYEPGDLVRFRRNYEFDGVKAGKGEYLRVLNADQDKGEIALALPGGKTALWRPAQKGAAMAEVFSREKAELREGDRIVWTRTDKAEGLRNGERGIVTGLGKGQATVRFESRSERVLSFSKTEHGHWRHGYAQTAYAAQGRTSDRVIVHAELNRINLINQPAFYVALSRARNEGTLVTDSRSKLIGAVSRRAGMKETALEADAKSATAPKEMARPEKLSQRLSEKLHEMLLPKKFMENMDVNASVERAGQRLEAARKEDRSLTGRPQTLREIADQADRDKKSAMTAGQNKALQRGRER